MATRGFLAVENFAKVGGLWQSLGVVTFTPSVDAAGIETFDRTVSVRCGSSIGDLGGNEFRSVVVGYGVSASTDKLTGLPSVSWQVNGTTPTETSVAESVPLRIIPNNGEKEKEKSASR